MIVKVSGHFGDGPVPVLMQAEKSSWLTLVSM
ncbi:hypothetical protein FOQG_05862 [Fusarium oxysporum f. sp. raphani 54005]|uniref:Uncharacterized protein n=8 Tax=Fusarium oxysporum TaxID=5507 RepID=W9IU45_FUSOX|nr:hypothetical protein FOXG_19833 [Fusarium oxysporum f. sp. lycopersici 4287]EWY96845.1 hypothetical protein FOYG_05405 [Fusarium oxysporum NRRL 32931]EWZ41324.1 hypothetical protein FOZG_06656 [Fusarium oxysporum Fo47]EXA01577.1 hypothetical protein FOWG_01389 [Fusarium oxysporum f. sp. lycopersici MN25]EXA48417.1 hypothetical protein FOVG_05177 [Fusarium oxysporum f. sp. pisi HDV247]EXK32268.1 hypothetical protein FOMG_12523 [Fusarium oxysporum f. sp. melonis 26406]EXK92862.1 hypothetical